MNDKLKRIVATVIDFYSICLLASIFTGIITKGNVAVTPFSATVYVTAYFLLLLFKDIVFSNASLGKRICNLKVVKTDGTKLTVVDVIKRNLPGTILLPVEILLLLFNNRRLGDAWAKTAVVHSDCNAKEGNE